MKVARRLTMIVVAALIGAIVYALMTGLVSGVKSNIDDVLWRVGLRVTAAKHHEFKECHGFRKYFKTYAQRTMSSEFVERLLGHPGNWSDAAYNRPLDDWIIDSYLKAVPDLTVYKSVSEEQLQWMDSKGQEVQQLKEQMSQMQQLFFLYPAKRCEQSYDTIAKNRQAHKI